MLKWNERLFYVLWEVLGRLYPLAEAAIQETSMNRPGFGMLTMAAAAPGITIAEITRQLPVTQQAVSQQIARLHGLGLIERRLLEGRSVGLYLTDAGSRTHAAGEVADLAFEEELAAALGRERYNRLRKLLLEMNDVIQELAAEKKHPSAKLRADPCEATAPSPRARSRAAKKKRPARARGNPLETSGQ